MIAERKKENINIPCGAICELLFEGIPLAPFKTKNTVIFKKIGNKHAVFIAKFSPNFHCEIAQIRGHEIFMEDLKGVKFRRLFPADFDDPNF